MRKFYGLVLIIAALWAARQIYLAWDSFMARHSDLRPNTAAIALPPIPGDNMPGLPPELEPSLREAEGQGPQALKRWLLHYGVNIADPRRAWIELDYVVMIAPENMNEARHIFAAVKARTPKTSPVYTRIQSLSKAYE
ncbi:MAG: hypothetical protein M1608_02600 [Candidatus Omnitrophica bacterium]|nr:hypothetical protein [Candidatus Omnitrophota bacterium]